MRIDRLRLTNYRNYEQLRFEPARGINVLVGDNAQGKTNALEAIFLCAFGRSHRTPRDGELIMRGTAGGYVGAEIGGEINRLIEIKLRAGENKKLFIDREQAVRTGELMGILNVVMFSPEDLALVKQGPAERRRFMDMELCQMQPAYYYRLQQYNRALRQRNALLKDDSCAPGMLTLFDQQLAELGEGVVHARCAFLDALSTVARDLHSSITGGREKLNVYYLPNIDPDAASVQQSIMEALAASAAEDMRRGFTTVGPHRDDIGIKLNGTDVRTYGSQGQQRTAALSIKLSELALLNDDRGEPPVLLLDDVFSELDDSRQRLLLGAMQSCQSFLTCTSLAGITGAGARDITVFDCAAGTLCRV